MSSKGFKRLFEKPQEGGDIVPEFFRPQDDTAFPFTETEVEQNEVLLTLRSAKALQQLAATISLEMPQDDQFIILLPGAQFMRGFERPWLQDLCRIMTRMHQKELPRGGTFTALGFLAMHELRQTGRNTGATQDIYGLYACRRDLRAIVDAAPLIQEFWPALEAVLKDTGRGCHLGYFLHLLASVNAARLLQTYLPILQNSTPDMVVDGKHRHDHAFPFALQLALNIIPLLYPANAQGERTRLARMRAEQSHLLHQIGRTFNLSSLDDTLAPIEIVVMTMPKNLARAQATAQLFQEWLAPASGRCHIWSAYDAKEYDLSGHVGLRNSILDHYLPYIRSAKTSTANSGRYWLMLEDDARPSLLLHNRHLGTILKNWVASQDIFPSIICSIGFHPRCHSRGNHSLDIRPKHGLHGWFLDGDDLDNLLSAMEALDPVHPYPFDIFLFEAKTVKVTHTAESVFGYIEHVSDTEGFHRAAYVPLQDDPSALQYALHVLPLR